MLTVGNVGWKDSSDWVEGGVRSSDCTASPSEGSSEVVWKEGWGISERKKYEAYLGVRMLALVSRLTTT